jgi:hypothetical protein
MSSASTITAHLEQLPLQPDRGNASGGLRMDWPTATSRAGRIIDALVVSLDRTGATGLVRIKGAHSRAADAIALMDRWIEDFGSERDPDLDAQLEDLQADRLRLER